MVKPLLLDGKVLLIFTSNLERFVALLVAVKMSLIFLHPRYGKCVMFHRQYQLFVCQRDTKEEKEASR